MVTRWPSRLALRVCFYNCLWQNAEILKERVAYSFYMLLPAYANYMKDARLWHKLTDR
jgi:hypothetical protein